MSLAPGTRLSHYEIRSQLGAGGMGEVYLAVDTKLDRTVALKILPAEVASNNQRVRRFIQEAKAASALNHPHIITIHEVGEVDSIHFIATEFIDGLTLRDSLKSDPLPIEKTVDIATQAVSALTAAHAVNIVHRDIKPENIMLRRDGYVKILDFGLAKLTELVVSDPEGSTLVNTAAGIVLGTLSYMSPEQSRGLEVDARSDIWSMGVVLYEMVAGRAPFQGTTMSDVIASVLDHEPPPLSRYAPDVPPELERINRKSLAKDRGERYQTSKDFLLDLKAVKHQLEISKGDSSVTPRTKIPRKTVSLRLIAGLGIALVAIAATLFLVRNRIWQAPNKSGGPITLAILPFYPLNAAEEIGFLSTGLPDGIITRLANVHQIRVRPTSSILKYEGQKVTAQAVGQELASDYVVMGTVQKVGDRLHVNVQLVRTSDETPLWGDQFDKERTDLLSLQDAVATQIAEALRIKMTSAEESRVYRRYTDNVAAYELYLLGRSKLVRYTKEDTLAAVKAFEEALSLDRNNALAYAGLAEASAQMRIRFAPEAEVKGWEGRAKQAAKKALELDPDLAEAHEALASVYRNSEFNWEQTIEESNRALRMNPNLDQSHYYRAAAFYHLGLLELAEREVELGLQINPLNRLEALRTRGAIALIYGKYSEAVNSLEAARGISSAPVIDWYLAQAYYYEGQRERGEKLLSDLRGSAQAEQRAKATLASFLAARGEKQAAQKLAVEVEAGSYLDHHVYYSLGVTYAQLGDPVKARLWLGRALESGFPCYPWFQQDALLQPLKSDPEFQSFIQDLQKSWQATRSKYE
jgi:serine/threonine protein kinase/tetratricopeptide (TPR) repeat protein